MSLIELTAKNQYDMLTKASTIVGAIGTRTLVKKAWKAITKKEPPQNPDSPDVLWKEALLWGASTGLAVGVIKIVARRLTAASWKKYKGPKPV